MSEREPTDEALAARASKGDSSAFVEIVTRYQRRAYRLARRLIGDDDDAFDVTQEAFLRAFRKLDTFRGESRFATWFYRIATNAALAHLRTRARRRTEPLDDYLPRFDADGVHRETPEELRIAGNADELLDREQLAQRIEAALDRLPASLRTAFVLRDLEELPTLDVAATLGLKPATVRQRVHRARLLMRGFLADLAGVKS